MSRIDDVIQEVKNSRKGSGRAWIFDEDGNIANGAIYGDVIPLLEDLKEYELDVTDEWIEDFLESPDVKGDNTYNWGARISNDLNLNYGPDENGNEVLVVMVHLRGDIRGGYSDYFVVEGGLDALFNAESAFQYIDIGDRYSADINIFSEGYEVYDNVTEDDIGTFYEDDVEDLLEELNKHEEE